MESLNRQIAGSHYRDLAIQPIEYSMANNLGICEANIIKYATRHASKGQSIDDLRKVIHYAEILIEWQLSQVPEIVAPKPKNEPAEDVAWRAARGLKGFSEETDVAEFETRMARQACGLGGCDD